MIRIYPSEEGFEEISFLSEMIARYKNPQLFFDLKDIHEVERLAELSALEEMMKELIG
jgi:hypothetical protein